jgi:hypothetical protein
MGKSGGQAKARNNARAAAQVRWDRVRKAKEEEKPKS